jgi:hypothetical protein
MKYLTISAPTAAGNSDGTSFTSDDIKNRNVIPYSATFSKMVLEFIFNQL